MPIPTPFHPCTSALCTSQEWRNWSGYLSAATYGYSYEYEYYAIRNAAALIDVSPLFKYEIQGPDAVALLNRVMTRDVGGGPDGRVYYAAWCDDEGKVIDDGTIQRLGPDRFRVTAADPNLRWFQDCGLGMDVQIRDDSERLAALAVQGPLSREVLAAAGADVAELRYFHVAPTAVAGIPLEISRTGYTGDLGYELWVEQEQAPVLWEALVAAGRGYGLAPSGLAALDLTRIEAGLLLIEVDYISSRRALIDEQLSTPFELGLGWTVDLEKPAFVGRAALQAEAEHGSAWGLVGLEADWPALQALFEAEDLPPHVAGRASRLAVPLYRGGRQVGQATSRAFSPILKKYLALATVEIDFTAAGTELEMEITVEYSRRLTPVRVVDLPFYDPPHKKSS